MSLLKICSCPFHQLPYYININECVPLESHNYTSTIIKFCLWSESLKLYKNINILCGPYLMQIVPNCITYVHVHQPQNIHINFVKKHVHGEILKSNDSISWGGI